MKSAHTTLTGYEFMRMFKKGQFDFWLTIKNQTEAQFIYFGGEPKVVKIDNVKVAILKANFYEPVYQISNSLNSLLSNRCLGKVEAGIKFVKKNFFLGRQFDSADDLFPQAFDHRRLTGCTPETAHRMAVVSQRKTHNGIGYYAQATDCRRCDHGHHKRPCLHRFFTNAPLLYHKGRGCLGSETAPI